MLLKRILFLLDKDKHEMMKHLDDMVNILRALIMDPAPEIQVKQMIMIENSLWNSSDFLSGLQRSIASFYWNNGKSSFTSFDIKKIKNKNCCIEYPYIYFLVWSMEI